MTSSSRSTVASAVWVTVVIVIAIVIGGYFIWPQASAYWTNMNVKRVIKGKAMSCSSFKGGSPEECMEPIKKAVKMETGVELNSTNLSIQSQGKRVRIDCTYKLKLEYPITGNMLGGSSARYKRYKWVVDMESKYSM